MQETHNSIASPLSCTKNVRPEYICNMHGLAEGDAFT